MPGVKILGREHLPAMPFLGHPPMMALALTEITLCYRGPVAPGHSQHIGPGRFHMVVEPPLSPLALPPISAA
ncbi:hypothetical protein MHZ93_19295 [Roseomonas sp. ACRSG]|nr:hypothetical protein [Roseomonas sp. ACRSG]